MSIALAGLRARAAIDSIAELRNTLRMTVRRPPLVLASIVLWSCASRTSPQDAALPDGAPADVAVDAPSDASSQGDADAGQPLCAEAVPIHSVYPGPLFVAVGSTQRALLRLRQDRRACAATYALSARPAGLLELPPTITVARSSGSVEFAVRGMAEGVATVTAVQVEPLVAGGPAPPEASFTVHVRSSTVPSCPAATPEITGTIAPGMVLRGAVGAPFEHASVGLSPHATGLSAMPASIACADDAVPEGYEAIGPSVRFGPGSTRLLREMELTVPAVAARVPSLFHRHIELAWSGPGPSARPPRIVPLANTRITADGRAVAFSSMRLGTFRAVIRRGLGAERVARRAVWRAISGISMGGVGSSMIGTRNPARFDAIAPLGGPADSGFSSYALRSWVAGGFCSEAQRATLGDAACASSSSTRVPPSNDLSVDVQDFEHFYAPPGMGTGGTFDRRARINGFRDITRMFGNPLTYSDPMNGVLPLGVPATELARADDARCRAPVVLGGAMDPRGRYYDDEYNPDGRFSVITFCDGNSVRNQPGLWAGGQGTVPFEIALAVDRNGNGVRDAGEPVIRNVGEPYRDVGVDGLPSAMEPGYDALSNPDPSGDDYDRQFNPSGLEANFVYDLGEPFDDVGVDGVPCPSGERCPYDHGEGNARYDSLEPPGDDRRSPRRNYVRLPASERDRLAFWVDGGVRDALQFGVNANHFASALAEAGRGLQVFNGFDGLTYGREPDRRSDAMYIADDIDWARLPQNVLLRYGSYDATPEAILAGDGAHVGTADQIANRLTAAFSWISGRWPGLDRTITPMMSTRDDAGRCSVGYACTFELRSDRANRTGPVSVFLPPGYHRPENRERRYPVVYVLHGYGMQPSEIAALGVIISQRMVDPQLADWQRLAKFIMVFPDGRCRTGDGCIEGTFFADSPIPGGPRMEQFFLDIYDFVERTYRVLPPSTTTIER